jgi:hypothetical protein
MLCPAIYSLRPDNHLTRFSLSSLSRSPAFFFVQCVHINTHVAFRFLLQTRRSHYMTQLSDINLRFNTFGSKPNRFRHATSRSTHDANEAVRLGGWEGASFCSTSILSQEGEWRTGMMSNYIISKSTSYPSVPNHWHQTSSLVLDNDKQELSAQMPKREPEAFCPTQV